MFQLWEPVTLSSCHSGKLAQLRKITILNGKTHYFYGHVQELYVSHYQRVHIDFRPFLMAHGNIHPRRDPETIGWFGVRMPAGCWVEVGWNLNVRSPHHFRAHVYYRIIMGHLGCSWAIWINGNRMENAQFEWDNPWRSRWIFPSWI